MPESHSHEMFNANQGGSPRLHVWLLGIRVYHRVSRVGHAPWVYDPSLLAEPSPSSEEVVSCDYLAHRVFEIERGGAGHRAPAVPRSLLSDHSFRNFVW